MAFQLILAAALSGVPVADLQGEWYVTEWNVRAPGKETWHGARFGNRSGPFWRVRGRQVEVRYCDKLIVNRLAVLPNRVPEQGEPTEVRFMDYDGVVLAGSCRVKDGQAVLTLQGPAPIPGLVNTNGTKYLTIKLERPKPPPPIPGIRLLGPPRIDP